MLKRMYASYGRGRHFLWDFAPFVLVLATYDLFTSLIHFINSSVHYQPMLTFDSWLGQGTIPTVHLQTWLYSASLHWYDYYFFVFYLLHLILPVLLGFLIWKRRINFFRPYVACFLLISLLAFLAFLIYPAAPPWFAAGHGMVAGLHAVISTTWDSLSTQHLATYFRSATPDKIAAMPSLHAAFAMFFWLYVRRIWSWRWAVLAAIYPLTIWFGVIYLGEHYVLDVLAGIALAMLCYQAVQHRALIRLRVVKLKKLLVSKTA